jgi:hypothetical protein
MRVLGYICLFMTPLLGGTFGPFSNKMNTNDPFIRLAWINMACLMIFVLLKIIIKLV